MNKVLYSPPCIGFFGEVFRGMWNGTDVAIKVFLEQDLNAENMEDFCNEISILRYLLDNICVFSRSITVIFIIFVFGTFSVI